MTRQPLITIKKILCITLSILLFPQLPFIHTTPTLSASTKNPPILGDYAAEIREMKPRKDGLFHVDTPRLIKRLKELKVNTYFFLIWHSSSDWDDLRKEFLPEAKKAGIQVWAYLVPPTEAKKIRSEPYGTDYIAWFRAVGRLSRTHTNLKGIVIDDFNENTSFFSSYYLRKARSAGKSENAQFRFIAQIYYPAITSAFIKKYSSLVDGIVMAFRDDTYRNTQRIDSIFHQMDQASSSLRQHHIPLIIMIYTSRLWATPMSPSPHYVEGALKAALHRLKTRQIEGVVTYVLHKEPLIEKNEDTAYRGYGYGNLFSPTSQLPKDAYTELQQKIYIHPNGPYEITFSNLGMQSLNIWPDSYQSELLLDHKIIWKQPINSKNNGKWKEITVDLSPYLSGKKSATLSLRLHKTRAGNSNWAYSGFDHFIATGFNLSNGHFEKELDWSVVSNNRTMIGTITRFDPHRRQKTFESVRKHYTAFDLYNQIETHLQDPNLARKADYFFSCILFNREKEARITLAQIIEHISTSKEASSVQKKLLISIMSRVLVSLEKENNLFESKQ